MGGDMRLRLQRAWARLDKLQAERDRIRWDSERIQVDIARTRMGTLRIEAEMHRAAIMHDIAVERLRLELLRIKRDTKVLDDTEGET